MKVEKLEENGFSGSLPQIVLTLELCFLLVSYYYEENATEVFSNLRDWMKFCLPCAR